MRFLLRATKEGHVQSERVWSALAEENPIDSAAATNSTDWYAKYPHVADQEKQMKKTSPWMLAVSTEELRSPFSRQKVN
jgi:hypothetical protein